MAITWTDVTAIAPELSTAALATQTAVLASVELQVNDDAWDDLASTGKAYLAAHLATLAARGASGAAGPVTSESVGQLSRSYAAPATPSSSLGLTSYGQEYLRLTRILPSVLGLCV